MVHYYMAQYYKKDECLHFARKPEDFAKKDLAMWNGRRGRVGEGCILKRNKIITGRVCYNGVPCLVIVYLNTQ